MMRNWDWVLCVFKQYRLRILLRILFNLTSDEGINVRKIADFFATLVILSSIAVLVVWLSLDLEEEYRGKLYVVDGDSITLGVDKFRLEGIDAPEYNQTCTIKGAQYACGKKSRNHLKKLVSKGNVHCKAWQRDKYQRLLGRCYAGQIFLNEQMVKSGWAVSYGEFHSQESFARKNMIGIWAGEFIRPREWRLSTANSVETGLNSGQDKWWKTW